MKVLWFANYCFSDVADSCTGTWLGAMGRALVASGQIELYNITTQVTQRHVVRADACGVRQWVLPWWKIRSCGLPDEEHLQEIVKIVKEINPELIHVWGLESYYGLLVARGIIRGYRSLLDMQGIRFAVGEFFMGNLTADEQRRCEGVKELLKPVCSPRKTQQRYLGFRDLEKETLLGFSNVAYQSEWVHDYLRILCPRARLHQTGIMLRSEFRDAPKWSLNSRSKAPRYIFSMCAGNLPYKGLHLLIRAFAILKESDSSFHDVKLLIGGGTGRSGILRSGYLKFVEREMNALGIKDDVEFLGALTASQIRERFMSASLFVHPSFIESYSLTVAEAMSVGVPCVVSHAGAMSELAIDTKSALYFPSGDVVLCAERMQRLLKSDQLSEQLSTSALQLAQTRNDPKQVVKRQLEIYHEVAT